MGHGAAVDLGPQWTMNPSSSWTRPKPGPAWCQQQEAGRHESATHPHDSMNKLLEAEIRLNADSTTDLTHQAICRWYAKLWPSSPIRR